MNDAQIRVRYHNFALIACRRAVAKLAAHLGKHSDIKFAFDILMEALSISEGRIVRATDHTWTDGKQVADVTPALLDHVKFFGHTLREIRDIIQWAKERGYGDTDAVRDMPAKEGGQSQDGKNSAGGSELRTPAVFR